MNSQYKTKDQQSKCGCQLPETNLNSNSVSLSRLDDARKQLNDVLSAKLKKSKCLLEDSTVHCFDNGFGVGSWAISQNKLTFAASGVVDKIPSLVSLVFDTSFFDSGSKGEDQNILWIDMDIIQPIPRKFRIPFRGVGVLRDPGSGNLLRCEDFELATDLIADVKDIAKIIACVLACVGLFCAAVCAPLCVAIIACIACLGACIGANVPQFLVCVTACGIALDKAEGALT